MREVRRRIRHVSGTVERVDGTTEPLTAASLSRAPELALQTLAVAVVALALALVVLRVT